MKSRYVLVGAILICGISSYVSAEEFLTGGLENSILDNPFAVLRTACQADSWFTESYFDTYGLHLASLQAMSPGASDKATGDSFFSSGRISTRHNYLEITPMWGYTFGGEFEDEDTSETLKIGDSSTVGFRLAYDYEYNSQIEFLYSHQETRLSGGDLFPRDALFDLDVDYYHIGGSLFWERGNELEPYFTGTLGLTHFNPQDSGADSLAGLSMGFGGGVRYFPLQRLGLYTGLRGMVTFLDSDIEVYSGSRGTFVVIKAEDLWQFQFYAGLVFVF